MQMQSVDTSAGTAICGRAVQDRLRSPWPLLAMALDVLDGDGGVVHQDAHREGEAAERHDVDGLAEQARGRSPSVRIESGMDTAMMTVLPPAPEEDQDHRRR